MDLHIVAILFYSVLIEANEFVKTGSVGAITVPEKKTGDNPNQVLALLIVEHNANSQESDESIKNMKPRKVPWISSIQSNRVYTDSSGDSNSDDYDELNSDTDIECNYYHENDYKKLKAKAKNSMSFADFLSDDFENLRSRWKSCQKKAAKFCRKACIAAYKNGCDEFECKRKFKKVMKKECKLNCKDFFM